MKNEMGGFENPEGEKDPEKAKERKAKEFQNELLSILNKPLMVENINTYADNAVHNLIDFSKQVVEEYQTTHPETSLSGKQLEDAAFSEYQIKDIPALLDAAQTIVVELREIDALIKKEMTQIEEVIIPPDSIQEPLPTEGERAYEAKEIMPRLKTLLYILKEDFNIDFESIQLTKGQITKEMMRKLSYVTVEIPELERVVQVCDEEGNASYIFDETTIIKEGITIDDLNKMTKEEKNIFITDHPDAGKRLVQTHYWRENMSELLGTPLPRKSEETTERVIADLPKVSTAELDPWRGFWTDPETGQHWGTVAKIATKTGISFWIIKTRIGESGLKSIQVWSRRIFDAYRYEEVMAQKAIRKIMEMPKVEAMGDWKGFYTDKEGRHWGAIGTLKERLSTSVTKLVKTSSLKSIRIKMLTGVIGDAYCYEEILEIKSMKEFLAAPTIEDEGEWKGFYIDKEGKHWTSIFGLANKLGSTNKRIKAIIKAEKIKPIRLAHGEIGRLLDGYCYEDLIAGKSIIELLSVPEAENVGEWKGFYIDKEGKHWGPVDRLSTKVGRDFSYVQKRTKSQEMKSTRIKGLMNKIINAYCYEDLMDFIAKENPEA